MSDSTSLLTQLTSSQSSKEITVNELMNSVSHAATFGRRQSTSGLNWDWFGGRLFIDGVTTAIANGTTALTASTTNYVEVTRTGTVSTNTSAFTPGRIPLYSVVTGASTISSYTDQRPWLKLSTGKLARSLASDADITLTAGEAMNDILEFTSGVSLTATRNVVVPIVPKSWIVFNNTTGAQSIQFIGATGTGITVANGKRAIVYADGTNIVRVTGDT